MPAKEQKKEQKKDQKKEQKRTIPMSEEEKAAKANLDKCEKKLEELSGRLKEVMGKIHEKDNTRRSLQSKIVENREAIKKKSEQIDQKRKAQKESLDRALKYVDALRSRKHRRSDERKELVKLLPRDAELPPLTEDDDESAHFASDYDHAIKLVQQEINRLNSSYATRSTASVAEERKQIGAIARWNSVIEKIKELEAKAAAPLAELAEVDVPSCLETCRKLKEEIRALNESCIPHYNAIAEASKKIIENRADVPKLVQERVSIYAEIKEVVDHMHEIQVEVDKAYYKSIAAHNEKVRADLLQESANIKARNEELKKNREEIIRKAMNTLPHEREVIVARQILNSLRSVALPGTCGIPESSAAPKQKAQPSLTSAPAMELEEAAPAATTMVVSRKSQPVAKVGKKQNKKKKAAAPAAAPAPEGPKKRSKEDHVRIPPIAANLCQELAVNIPDTYAEVEETYNMVKEKLEAFEKIRAMVREQHEKELEEAEKKAEEQAAKKAAERAKAKAEAEADAEKPAEEAKDEAAVASAAEPAAEESAPAEPAAAADAEPAPAEESQ